MAKRLAVAIASTGVLTVNAKPEVVMADQAICIGDALYITPDFPYDICDTGAEYPGIKNFLGNFQPETGKQE